MAKKIVLKTGKNSASATRFIAAISDEKLRSDSKKLLTLFKSVTGQRAKMWGTSIVGFGEYTYNRSNGDEGQFLATGFSPRKSGPTIYIMPGFKQYGDLLAKLGKHKISSSCLSLKSLEGIDMVILRKLISQSLRDLKKTRATNY